MKTIKKDIEDLTGATMGTWVATDINIQLYRPKNDPDTFVQKAQIHLKGFVNGQAVLDGKSPGEKLMQVDIDDVTQLDSYETIVTEAVSKILADPQFTGGTIEEI